MIAVESSAGKTRVPEITISAPSMSASTESRSTPGSATKTSTSRAVSRMSTGGSQAGCCPEPAGRKNSRCSRSTLASIAKALGDPVRIQLVDVLRKHAGKVCVCELVPLFDLAQPTVSHHLKVLREAGIVGSERQGLWAYYYVIPDALEELSAWLT